MDFIGIKYFLEKIERGQRKFFIEGHVKDQIKKIIFFPPNIIKWLCFALQGHKDKKDLTKAEYLKIVYLET